MGIFVVFGSIFLMIIVSEIDKHQGDVRYKKYQEEKRRRGLIK